MGNANSGNKSTLEKNNMAINMSLYDVLAWKVLVDDSIPDVEKVKMFMPLACKHVKTEIDFNASGSIILNIIKNSDERTQDVIDHETVKKTDGSV